MKRRYIVSVLAVIVGLIAARDLLMVRVNHSYQAITGHTDLITAAAHSDVGDAKRLAATYNLAMQQFHHGSYVYGSYRALPQPSLAVTADVTAATLASSPSAESLNQLSPYTHLDGLRLWIGCVVPSNDGENVFVFYNKALL